MRAVDGWPAANVAVGVVCARNAVRSAATRPRVPLGLGDEAGDRARVPRRRRGGDDRPRRAGRAAGLDRSGTCSRTRPGCRSTRASPIARPGARRIYSDHGFDVLGAARSPARAGMPFAEYLAAAVLEPARPRGAASTGRPARGCTARSTTCSLLGARAARADARRAGDARRGDEPSQFPGLVGVLPGFGRQEPNDWGLGFELRDGKAPHWTGSRNSARTFGHFGRSGTFLWVDPEPGVALCCLTDLEFGDWATRAWPSLSDAVLSELRSLRVTRLTSRHRTGRCLGVPRRVRRRPGPAPAEARPCSCAPATSPAGTPSTTPPGIGGLAPDLSGLHVAGRTDSPALVRGGDAIRVTEVVFSTPKEAAEAVKRGSGDDYQAALERSFRGDTVGAEPGAGYRLRVPRPTGTGFDTVDVLLVRHGRRVAVVELVSARGFDPALRARIVRLVSR